LLPNLVNFPQPWGIFLGKTTYGKNSIVSDSDSAQGKLSIALFFTIFPISFQHLSEFWQYIFPDC